MKVLLILFVSFISIAHAGEPFHIYAPSTTKNALLIVKATPEKDALKLELAKRVDVGFPARVIAANPKKPLLYLLPSKGDAGNTPAVTVVLDDTGNYKQHNAFTANHGASYLSLDRANQFLLGVSYGGGQVNIYPLSKSGMPGKAVTTIDEGLKAAHCVLPSPDNKYIYIPYVKDSNALYQYSFDPKTGATKPLDPKDANPPEGTGPRHMAYHPTKPVVYFSNEQHLGVSVYDKTDSGQLKVRQICDAFPKDFDKTGVSSSDIEITPDAKFLLAGIRGHKKDVDAISRYKIEDNGEVQFLGLTPADKIPWGLEISPDGKYLLVSATNGATLTAFEIGKDGDLKKVGQLAWDEKISDLVSR